MDRLGSDIGALDLADYASRLRRRWWAIVLGVALGVGGGWLFTEQQAPEYASTTAVLVETTPVGTTNSTSGRTGGDINLDTEAQLVRSARVARDVQVLLGTDTSVGVLRSATRVSVPPNSQVLTIEFTASTPEGAQAGAAAFADAYLAQRRNTVQTSLTATTEVLSQQLADARAQLEAIAKQAATLPVDSPSLPQVEAQRGIAVAQINDLTSRLSPLQAVTASPGTVITEANLPVDATSPVPEVNLAAGGLLGLALGLGLALLIDRADHRARRGRDLARRTALPVLSEVVLRSVDPLAAQAEHGPTFDRLRNAVTGSSASTRVVLVAGLSADRTAADVTALQLTGSLARAAQDVMLIVADPKSRLASTWGLEDSPGLAEVLLRKGDPDALSHRVTGMRHLGVLTQGQGELDRLLQTSGLGRVVDRLRAGGRVVVLLTGPPDTSAAAQAVARFADGALLVVDQRTDLRRLPSASAEVQRMGTEVLGVVWARVPRRRGGRAPGASAGTTTTTTATTGDKVGALPVLRHGLEALTPRRRADGAGAEPTSPSTTTTPVPPVAGARATSTPTPATGTVPARPSSPTRGRFGALGPGDRLVPRTSGPTGTRPTSSTTTSTHPTTGATPARTAAPAGTSSSGNVPTRSPSSDTVPSDTVPSDTVPSDTAPSGAAASGAAASQTGSGRPTPEAVRAAKRRPARPAGSKGRGGRPNPPASGARRAEEDPTSAEDSTVRVRR